MTLLDDIIALGGDNDDFNLVNDVDSDVDVADSLPDPDLANDLAKFLKGLDLPSVAPDDDDDTPTSNPPSDSPTPIAQSPQWYLAVPPLPPSPTPLPTPTPSQLTSLTSRAESLHASLSTSPTTSTPSDTSFLSKILASGTLSDRLSALTLLAQSSPIHNTKALDSLKNMASKGKGAGGGRDESLKALRCIVDWWVGGGAPDRKLKYFREQPLLHPAITDSHLVVWYFEDWLKKYFFSLLQILETLSLDPLPYVRTQTLTFLTTLLRDKPEQEQNLLRLLVNKLGDTEKSIASRASYHILQLLQAHPAMKAVVVREISALVLRPLEKGKSAEKTTPTKSHARYYASITFNQIMLLPTPADRDVARALVGVYFELFKEILGEGLVDVEAEPEADGADEKGKVKDGKGKGKWKGRDRKGMRNEKGKPKAKSVKGDAGFAELEDSDSRLVSAILTGVNRALPFAKIDVRDAMFNSHIDTLFRISHTSTFNISLQALALIQQISVSLSSSSVTDRYFRTLYASLHDPRLFSSSKQAMYLNLMFKSLKSDGPKNLARVGAFVRRFVQVLVSGGGGASEFVAGGLYLLGELFSTTPGLRDMISVPANERTDGEGTYDPRKRDPQHAHAMASPLWELVPLLHHHHPTVSLHARQLLSSQPLTATADLSINTLSHFLDRFVYKNPKKPRPRGSSAMQPAASAADGTGVRLVKGETAGGEEGTVRETTFWKRGVEDVPVHEVFFHRFFSTKYSKEMAKSGKVGKRKAGLEGDDDDDDDDVDAEEASEVEDEKPAGDDDDEEDSDEEEREIWKAMKSSIPAVEGDDDLMDDSDDVPSGLDEEDSDSGESDDDDEVSQGDDDDGEDAAFSMAEASDADDLVDLDAEAPAGLIEYDGSDVDEDEEWGGIDDGSKKRKRGGEDKSSKRKKLRSLPTFASYEDYAKMIEEGPEDDI